MKLLLKFYCLFGLLFIMQQNNCYAQLSYNELPDTLFQEYEVIVERKLPKRQWVNYSKIVPAKLKSSVKTITTKYIYKDCNDCVYEEYIDSLEIRPGYDKIILQKEVIECKYEIQLRSMEEYAWVKMYDEIPKDSKPCLDIDGIDTCLWKYVIFQEAKYDTLLTRIYNHIPDTIKISPIIIPIKKYRLKNKSSQEVEKLTIIDVETISVGFYIIEEEARIHDISYMNGYDGLGRPVRVLKKAVTPLNYGD